MELEVKGISYKQISFYILISYLILSSLSGWSHTFYMLWPSIWILFSLVIKYKLPKPKKVKPLVIRNKMKVIGLMGAVCTLATYLIMGALQGFRRNPGVVSSHTVLLNIWMMLPLIVTREYVRGYLIETYARKRDAKRLLGISILMMITSSALLRMSYRGTTVELIIDIVSIVIPLVCESLLGTYLVVYGGASASIYYFMITSAYEWISPILPYMNWFNKSIIGMILPVSIILYVHRAYGKANRESSMSLRRNKGIREWLIGGILSVLVLWFAVGIFPIYPSIIISGSMSPAIQVGDIITVKKLRDKEALDNLKVGDMIQFKQDNKLITHRIQEIQGIGTSKTYETKGDNNLLKDNELVRTTEVRGKVVGVIPKVGWIPLIIKQGLQNIK